MFGRHQHAASTGLLWRPRSPPARDPVRRLTVFERKALNEVLEMGSGYVLDFSNRTIEEFFADFEVDLYDDSKWAEKGTSKANRVRTFVSRGDEELVGRVLLALLDYRRGIGRQDPDEHLLATYLQLAARLGGVRQEMPGGIKRRPSPVGADLGDPSLPWAQYEHILRVCASMAEVMERGPGAFAGMHEEDLRNQFLVQLNGHYHGGASGETFNYEGKTDILLRHSGRVIFIAECKFWSGPKGLAKTIDQLLGYTSWRDTKVAILLFNRNVVFSEVVNQVPAVIRSHASYEREADHPSETRYRAVLRHPRDPARMVHLTILAFDVPSDPSRLAPSRPSGSSHSTGDKGPRRAPWDQE